MMTQQNFSNYIEKRIHRRVDSEIKVQVISDGKTFAAQAANISCGGMYLNLKNNNNIVGIRDLELAIHLPNHKKPVVMMAQMLRECVSGGVAVQFQGLYNDNVLEIERFVKSRIVGS